MFTYIFIALIGTLSGLFLTKPAFYWGLEQVSKGRTSLMWSLNILFILLWIVLFIFNWKMAMLFNLSQLAGQLIHFRSLSLFLNPH